jgi:hypothetical protein
MGMAALIATLVPGFAGGAEVAVSFVPRFGAPRPRPSKPSGERRAMSRRGASFGLWNLAFPPGIAVEPT